MEKKQQDALREDFSPQLTEQNEKGQWYVSHIHYRQRLLDVFGAGGWQLTECEPPVISEDGGYVRCHYGLHIHAGIGRMVSDAYADHRTNKATTIADALESARSDCLTRCCKDIGIGWRLWDRAYLAQLGRSGDSPVPARPVTQPVTPEPSPPPAGASRPAPSGGGSVTSARYSAVPPPPDYTPKPPTSNGTVPIEGVLSAYSTREINNGSIMHFLTIGDIELSCFETPDLFIEQGGEPYINCAVVAAYTVKGRFKNLIPESLEVADDVPTSWADDADDDEADTSDGAVSA
jgi:hypothetical protein